MDPNDMMRQRYGPQIVRKALGGVKRQTITAWFRGAGEWSERDGRRIRRHMSGVELWAMTVARVVRRHRESMDVCYAVYRLLAQWTPEQIEAWFAESKTALLMVNGRALPQLTHPLAMVTGNNARLVAEAKAKGLDVRLIIIHTEPLYRQIQGYLSTVHETN